jgi:hypothetical protein
MKHRVIWIALLVLVIFYQCRISEPDDLLEKLMIGQADSFHEILDHPSEYKVQILYTRINRDKNNQPDFRTFDYHVDPGNYFYPASMVKMPVAFFALERIHELGIPGLTKYSTMLTDSAYSGQLRVLADSSARDLKPSVAHYIKKIFLVSDNEAFNRLYEFLGPDYINRTLHQKGYLYSRIVHRLSVPLSLEENRYTNPVRFYNANDQLIYQQGLNHSGEDFTSDHPILLGEGFLENDSVIRQPMDFSGKNFIPLSELHGMLVSFIFPGKVDSINGFNLSDDDRKFLLTYMSMYPRESIDPYYDEKYDDNYCKFLMYADRTARIPGNIRIFNKIGLAYGFLVESAYIVDFETKIEFFLSAVISVNKNRIYNDGLYEYDSIGFPFMGNLGRLIYQYEKDRYRKFEPDLSEFLINDTNE